MKRIGTGLAAAALFAGFGVYRAHQAEDNAPKVGECAKVVGGDDIKKVDCTSSEATMVATSRVEDSADGEAACASDLQATSYYQYENHGTKFVVCFKDH
jgi:hypothetical protein